jgi:hypothetical protein
MQLLRAALQDEALGLLDAPLVARILPKLTVLPSLEMKPVYRCGLYAYTKSFCKTLITKLVAGQNAPVLSNLFPHKKSLSSTGCANSKSTLSSLADAKLIEPEMNDKIDTYLTIFGHLLNKVRFSDSQAAELVSIRTNLHHYFEDTMCFYLSKVTPIDGVVEYEAQGESDSPERHDGRHILLLEQTDPNDFSLPVQLNILLSFFLDKRLDEKVKQAEGGLIPLDARAKAEIKLLVELIKYILGRPEIVSGLYLANDFTCVRRPVISVMLKRSTDVLSSLSALPYLRKEEG